MAKVPVYDAPQVALNPLPGVTQTAQASPGAFSASADRDVKAGQQLIDAGREAARIIADMQDRENADMVLRAETMVKTQYLAFQGHAREERRGADAKNLTKDAAEWWDKKIEEHSGNLANKVQRDAFSQRMAASRLSSLESLSMYESDQRRAALNESGTASIGADIGLAASQVGTPTEVQAIMGAKGSIRQKLAALAKLNGMGGDSAEAVAWREAKEKEALTNLHMQVIQNMVADTNGGPARAKAYFEANKGEINGTNFDAIQNLWKTGSAIEVAQKTAADLEQKGMSEADGLTWIRTHLKGEEQERATLEWRQRHAEMTAARERVQREAADEAYGVLAKTGRISDITPALWAKLDGRTQLALKKAAEEAATERLPKTDWNKYYALRRAALADPEAFKRRDLRQDFGYLGKAERESLIDLQSKRPEEVKDVATLEAQISSMSEQLKLTGSSNAEKRGLFERSVRDAVAAEEARLGRKLSYKDRQGVIDRMVVEGEVLSGSWYLPDPNRRFFEVAGTPEASRFEPAVPKAERAKIEEALRRAGKRVTDEAVSALYRAKLGLPKREGVK